MNFTWLFALIAALVIGLAAAQCPAGTQKHGTVCGVQRPVRGSCPDQTQYNINHNLCVHAARP